MKLSRILGLVALTVGVSAHAGPSAPVLKHVAMDIIVKTYVDMAAGGQNLKAKIQVLHSAPTQENLEAAQQAWRDMRASWESSEAFLFGPVEDLNIDPAIDTWPLNRADLDNVLSIKNGPPQITPAVVKASGPNLQGYHTLEYLLFGNGENGPHKDAAALTSRELDYLFACATVLSDYSNALAFAYTTNADPSDKSVPGFGQLLANPNLENPRYPSEQAVLGDMVNGMLGIIDEVGANKMSTPMGGDIAHANVERVESPFSWNSLTDFTNNIRSVLNVYTGEYQGVKGGPGIRDVVARTNPALAAQVEDRIRHSMQLIQDVAGPNHIDFRQAILVNDGRARIKTAVDDLASLHDLINTQVLPLVQR